MRITKENFTQKKRVEEQEKSITCFNEIGNVSLPHCSGVWTISLVITLHDLQTEAQKTTVFRAGHEASLSSTLRIMSNSNSGGKFDHRPCWIGSNKGSGVWSGAICDLVFLCQDFLSPPRLDMLPIPSIISRSSQTMLLRDILMYITSILSPSSISNCKPRKAS